MISRIKILRRFLAAMLLAAGATLVFAAQTGRLGRVLEESRAARPPERPLATAVSQLHLPWPTFTPEPPVADSAPAPLPTAPPNKVGLIAGHWQYDSGAVCVDGRSEVEVTTDVSLRVQAILEVRGFDVEILPEHDPDVPQPPVQGYRAAALVAIHADSCNVPGASGFKVAHWPYSETAEADERLVECMYKEYAAATLLRRHEGSITVHMVNYYAFREIAAETPAAIIELGFLGDDRTLLDDHRYEMAMGIANGISCFLHAP